MMRINHILGLHCAIFFLMGLGLNASEVAINVDGNTVGSEDFGNSCGSSSLLGYDSFSENLKHVREVANMEASQVYAKVNVLEQRCVALLKLDPPTVVDKKTAASSGDFHDYCSLAPYWWPDPDKPDGLPYIRKDGEIYGEYLSDEASDANRIREMASAVSDLSLLYGFTKEERWAEKAVDLLETWFVDSETKMNPHLRYAQAIRGRNEGRCFGIIETARFTHIPLVLHLLDGSTSLEESTVQAVKLWFETYLDWLLISELGKEEGSRLNNHGTYYDVQVITYALFVGRVDLARSVLNGVPARRILSQIEPDGRQPHELARTKSLSYSLMNLKGMLKLAKFGRVLGIDLCTFKGPEGQSIRSAVDYLLPYTDDPTRWPLQQMKQVEKSQFSDVVLQSAILFDDSQLKSKAIDLWNSDSIDLQQLIWCYPLFKDCFKDI